MKLGFLKWHNFASQRECFTFGERIRERNVKAQIHDV